MHGDFSRWFAKVPKNQVGILAQEGRVLLDADVNAQSLIGARWQDLAARAAFGANVAAIPADNLDAWNVISAQLVNNQVLVNLMPGVAWADGLLVELEGVPTKPVQRVATQLGLPLQTPPADTGAAGTRDAVILEVWRRSLNGYQVPLELIEPALGGPDTAERIETAYALRLYRLGANDTCRTLKLNDDLTKHGSLHATLAPTTMTAGDCPVVQGGGYSGLEHDLYRIEIADVTRGGSMFKWSQWNGGLVGRGMYDAAAKKLSLVAGDQAILRSGLTAFYLEALVFDAPLGRWRVAYGAPATLDTDGEIDLSQAAMFGAPPPSTGSWFVRIWNGVHPISDFPAGPANELRDGIRLEFGTGTYVPGDYWTFPVRAGLDNPSPLIDHAPPFGIHHHRVALAELHWTANGAVIDEDCRVPLHPITATDGCCTHSVGDGVTSHGDFATVQGAIDALPPAGGRVCVLPGTYIENVEIRNRKKVELIGCGPRSRIIAKPAPGEFNPSSPAIHVLDTSGISIEKLYVEGGYLGIAILLEADAAAGTVDPDGTFFTPMLEDMRVAYCDVRAGGKSGIEIRGGHRAGIVHNRVSTADIVTGWSLITVATTDARIERNVVIVEQDKPVNEFSALGGIWLRGGCVNIDVLDNEITGGAGHGVMLGHAEKSAVTGATGNFSSHLTVGLHGFVFNDLVASDCIGCGPGPVVFPFPPGGTPPFVAADPLREIHIRSNVIQRMGISGIGVMGFFPTAGQGVIYINHLEITANRIVDNIGRAQAEIDGGMVALSGYGAISLADVSNLVVRDNEIAHNGAGAAGGVTGLFVLAGSDVEVSRNKIHDNGPLRPLRIVKGTPHGGIWLAGVSLAAGVRDNEVRAPNGPALFMQGHGFMQVVDNLLISQGMLPTELGASNVQILNLSALPTLSPASFAGLRNGEMTSATRAATVTVAGRAIPADRLVDTELAGARISFGLASGVIDAIFLPPPGAIMFNNNQVVTRTPEVAAGYSTIIAGNVDVSVLGNQFDSNAPDAPPQVAVLGSTLRVENNRFSDHALVFSLATYGMYNITAHNIADHCISVRASQQYVDQQNLELSGGFLCAFQNLLPTFGGIKI